MCSCLLFATFIVSLNAVHVAFIAPPASHYVPMIPISHGLLDEGHSVSFVGFPDTTKKIGKLVPKARLINLPGKNPKDDMESEFVKGMMQNMPYGAAQIFTNFVIPMMTNILGAPMALQAQPLLRDLKPDVLCVSFIYPTFYALGESLGIPIVGIGWASPSFLTSQLDLPWTAEPNIGSIHSRQELYASPVKLLENLAVRLFGFLSLRLGSAVNIANRFKLGHPQPMEMWEFDTVLQHPMVVMTLPELTAGMPTLVSPYTFMVGILDHPGMQGNSIAKSDDADRIISWLDERHSMGQRVLYVAFGSEVEISDDLAAVLVAAFSEGKFTVLWASKRIPKVQVPASVFLTKFAPQRAVLGHSAVFGFLSHGGANSVNEALMLGTPLVIMPFFGDQMAVALAQKDLGVASIVRKDATASEIVEAVRLIGTKPYQLRAADVKELNDQRKDMSRAVQVIVNQGSGKFRMVIPRVPNLLLRLVPLLLTLFMLGFCCNACCCCRIRPQGPCCCRGGGGASVTAAKKGKKKGAKKD